MKSVFCAALLCCTFALSAQENLWSVVDRGSVKAYIDNNKKTLPSSYQLLRLDNAKASQFQSRILPENVAARSVVNPALFTIPLNTKKDFSGSIVESPLLSQKVQQQNSRLKTYRLSDPVTKNLLGRISITPAGVTGLLFSGEKTFYISPIGNDYPGVHMIYDINDLKDGPGFFCGVSEVATTLRQQEGNRLTAGDCQLRTFRLAVAATGEYTTLFGGQANALTEITNTVNMVNAIYERDATIRFTLVTNNSIIYPTGAGDPYTVSVGTTASSTNLAENQAAIDGAFTSSGYDLGIVFHDGWNGGLASVGVVCNTSNKGRAAAGLSGNGYTGLQGPFFAATVAHEIAHQFSATHTFSANNGICNSNIAISTAYEPGGGSTIMAYAQNCLGNFYQRQSDLYFHTGSIQQIQNYVLSPFASCAAISSSGNTAPVVSVAASSYSIPVSTPFSLTATGSDADGNTLKYNWEQMDANFSSGAAPLPTNTAGPNFRSYPSTTSPTRVFPSIESLLFTPNAYEILPSVARTMNFRVTARDEAAGGGCTAETNVAVITTASAGPFQVNTQNSPVTLTANGSSTFIIGWDVNGTTGAPVNCAAVDILFSTDGGYTYPNTLIANTANDGSETIVVPNLPTSAGRIKVQAHNNIFFDINNANITINSSCIAQAATFAPTNNISATAGSAALDLSLNPLFGTPLVPSGTITSSDPSGNLALLYTPSNGCFNNFDNQYQYHTYSFFVLVGGVYTFQRSSPFGLVTSIYNGAFVPGTSCQNFISSIGSTDGVSPSSLAASFSVTLIANTTYTLTIGTFLTNFPTLPASYTINVTPPPGGNIYAAPPNPGAGYSYTYVIVDNATGLIKAIDAGADLSNAATFPSGTFSIYGLSYSNASAAMLPGFVGSSFNALQNSLLFDPANSCGNLSKNSITVSIQSALPVKLLPLKAYIVDKTVLLKWGTEFEQNADRFEIERSTDGINFSSALGIVKAKGNSNTSLSYDFTDRQPAENINYYRIKQFDIDGNFTLTNIAKVNMKSATFEITAYPSPATSTLTLEMYAAKKENIHVDILDSKGSFVSRLTMNVQEGINIKTLNVERFAKGIYVLKVSTQNGVVSSRFVKN